MVSERGWLPIGAPVPSLTRWGLSPDADLVYRTLVTFGAGPCHWLAHELSMPVTRVEAALDELVDAQVVVGSGRAGSAARWRARPVDGAVAQLRRRRQRALGTGGRQRARDASRRAHHHAVLSGDALANGPSAVELSTRRHAGAGPTRQRIAQLVATERREHLALNPEPFFTAQAVAAALPLDRELYARGVRVRICGVPPSGGDADWSGADPGGADRAEVHRLAALSGEYREHPQVPVKLMVFDRRVALLPADPVDLAAGALEIDEPAIVEAMVVLFEQVWSTASDPRRRSVPSVVLTPREQAIVGLLAEGHTDASVAQRLRISQRTIAYTLRALMDRVGVDNRFQLGLVLGEARAVARPSPEHEEDT